MDDNILLRLAQYAEVPIPTCPMQGGFQLTFRPSRFGTTIWTTVSVGRIGSYDYIPAQLSLEANESEAEIEHLKWIVSMLEQQVQATCFQKVFCTPEGQDSAACLQFLVPVSFENQLPLRWSLDDRQFCVDHPAPFAIPLLVSRRPPEEQSKLEHWKETANRSFSHRKGRQNSLAHHPRLADSMCRFNLLQHGDVLSNGKRFMAMYESNFLPFLFVDGKPDLDDLLEFCGEVFADNVHVGSGIASMTGDQHNSDAADIYCEVPTLYCLEVLQDKQEPLKIGRFLHSKKHFFASTTETLLCHAFTPCVVALVVPKGSTVDQVCGPRESYGVMKRIPLRCSSVPKVNCAGVDPPRNMNSQDAINPHGRSSCQPPALSYVDGQMAGKRVQAPTVAISPTAPWTRADNGLGSQLPKPVKAAVKNDEDALMQEAADPSLPKIVQKNHKKSALKEPDDVEMGGQSSHQHQGGYLTSQSS